MLPLSAAQFQRNSRVLQIVLRIIRMQTRNTGSYNSAKIRALEFFSRSNGWTAVPTWAAASHVEPIRRGYTYLARLAQMGLLERARDTHGRLLYRITDQGRRRLQWLISS